MAKTFDVSDPAQHDAYVAEGIAQMALYGNLYLRREKGTRITILDATDVQPGVPGQPGFDLVMDDGTVLPVPEPLSYLERGGAR